MRLIDADELRLLAIEKLHMVNPLGDITDLIDEAPTIEPSADIISCGVSADKSTEQNVADVPSGDLVSRQEAIEAVMAEGRNVHASEYANAERIIHEADAVEALAMLPSADRPTDKSCRDCPIYSVEPSGDLISRAEVLALINKAMYNTDNKDIQDYLFCGLRRDVHHLPSADRPKGEWIEVTNGRGGHECSNCHAYAPSYMSGDEYLSNFCPNCGARMKGGDDE